MEDNYVNNVIDLNQQGDWKKIIELYHDYPERSKLLWVFPSEENLTFLKKAAEELKFDGVVSIGCGSGLLEWIITKSTGLQVTGIEIDRAWWQCKYAPPTFIPLLCTSEDLSEDVIRILQNSRKALLFCYFNNRPAFKSYLQHFNGNVVIIIGPGNGRGIHTDPRPFDEVGEEWKLYKWEEVRDSKDFITIYCKNHTFHNYK